MYLDQWYDPELDVDLGVSADELAAFERARLAGMVAAAAVAATIPRRISDASREELALDKKRSRRILHVLSKCLDIWEGEGRDPTDDDRRHGAQVDWVMWHEEHNTWLKNRLVYVATWGKKSGELRFAKSAAVRLNQECDWLKYAMRD